MECVCVCVYEECEKKQLKKCFYIYPRSAIRLKWTLLGTSIRSKIDLRLGIGSCPRQHTTAPQFGYFHVEFVCEHNSQRHTLGGLVGRVAEHDALIAGTDVFLLPTDVDALRYFRRLLFNCRQNVARFVVES